MAQQKHITSHLEDPVPTEPLYIEGRLVSYRTININDFQAIKELHELFFPIKYGDVFYEKTCKGIGIGGGKLFSSLAVLDGVVIGFVLGQIIKYPSKCEDKSLFSFERAPKSVFYILTLGLLDQYRRSGLGSRLIHQCEEFAKLDWDCGGVYLHVITDNSRAIRFYRKNQYTELRRIEDFYHFDEQYHAAYLYIRYINNFKAPLPHRIWSGASYYLDVSIGYVTSIFTLFTPSGFSSIFPTRFGNTGIADSKNDTNLSVEKCTTIDLQ